MERDCLSAVVEQSHALLEGGNVGGICFAKQRHVGADEIIAVPVQWIEDDDGEAAGERNFDAFRQVAEHIAEDLSAASRGHLPPLDLAVIAHQTALSVLIVIERFSNDLQSVSNSPSG